MKEIVIGKNQAGQRFDKYLKKLLCNADSSFIYKMLRKKNILLNDRKAQGTEKLEIDDRVKLFFSDETFSKFSNGEEKTEKNANLPAVDLNHLPFQIIYESEDILVINKPSGMLSQKAKKEDVSANEYILSYLLKKGDISGRELSTFRPSVCNRLDRNTSGIIIAGKTLKGLQEMSQELKSRSLKKYYYALVKGRVTKTCRLKGYLMKDEKTNRVHVSEDCVWGEGKAIETEYIPLGGNREVTLLKIHLITGRSHQIRGHLAFLGHPIVGDYKYGDKKINEKYRENYGVTAQLLHAHTLVLKDGKKITAPLPQVFANILDDFGIS